MHPPFTPLLHQFASIFKKNVQTEDTNDTEPLNREMDEESSQAFNNIQTKEENISDEEYEEFGRTFGMCGQ